MTLYLKYRPQKIDELDLKIVRETLGKIVKSPNIPHAFLFCGPKGVGKTSSARILAKAINCLEKAPYGEPCNKCEQCTSITNGSNIDVIEMDAASNRGIDDIRELRERINLAPVLASKKIYIIDECHMLTLEASNALLKTLEEPPTHVIFILATTNPEKLPQTIHSRLTAINFQKATSGEIVRQLTRVCEGEKLKFEEEALVLIAKASDGSFRDAVKILEECILDGIEIKKDLLSQKLFQSNVFQIETFVNFMKEGDLVGILQSIENIVENGGQISLFIDQLLEYFHQTMLNQISNNSEGQAFATEQIIEIINALKSSKLLLKDSPIPQLSLEIEMVKLYKGKDHSKKELSLPKDEKPAVIKIADEPQKKTDEVIDSSKQIDSEVWKKILSQVGVKNGSIEALLRASKPISFDGENLTVGVYYNFHKERLEVGTNRQTLEEVVSEITGNRVSVYCTVTPKPQEEEKVSQKFDTLTEDLPQDIIKAAKDIFGG